jgi:putative ABC transport system ATP-binding protein
MQIMPSDLELVARVEHLTKSYGTGPTAVVALDDVSVGLRRGEFTAIMGPSGSGKSTLMHIMAGLDSPTTGRVWLGDREISGLPDAELTLLRRRRVGFVFQSFNLVPTLDVLGNIELPFELDGHKPSSTEQQWIDDLVVSLELVNRLRHRPWELSGPGPSSCSQTSPPATSTPTPVVRCSRCCGRPVPTTGRASRWSPTIRSPRATPTG